MCRMCERGFPEHCLGVVYYVLLHEFRECMTQAEARNATV